MSRFKGSRRSVMLAASCAAAWTTLGALATASTGSFAQSLEPVKVRLDWTPWGVHAAIHLAQQKGWFKAAGLDPSIEDGNGSVTTVQIVGSSGSFDVGHAALASMMIARDKGLPVKAVAVFARHSDVGLLAPKEANITGPAQLRGKKIAYTAGSLEAPFIDSFLAAGKLKRSDVELVNVDAASKIGTYSVGRTDAVFSTIPFVLPSVNKSRPSVAVRFSDFGLDMPSFGLFATEEKLAARGEVIAKFASVVSRAWEYVYAGHQNEAVDAILAQRPQARLDREVLRGQIDALEPYFGKHDANTRIGPPIPAEWDRSAKTLNKVGLIGDKRPGSDYYAAGVARPERFDSLIKN